MRDHYFKIDTSLPRQSRSSQASIISSPASETRTIFQTSPTRFASIFSLHSTVRERTNERTTMAPSSVVSGAGDVTVSLSKTTSMNTFVRNTYIHTHIHVPQQQKSSRWMEGIFTSPFVAIVVVGVGMKRENFSTYHVALHRICVPPGPSAIRRRHRLVASAYVCC